MLEKSAKVVLTSYDLNELAQGRVSQRLEELWGLTLEQLKSIVKNHEYVKIDE